MKQSALLLLFGWHDVIVLPVLINNAMRKIDVLDPIFLVWQSPPPTSTSFPLRQRPLYKSQSTKTSEPLTPPPPPRPVTLTLQFPRHTYYGTIKTRPRGILNHVPYMMMKKKQQFLPDCIVMVAIM